MDWDEHLLTFLFLYITTYKVAIKHTSYQLVYGLHPLMPTKYIFLVINSDHKERNPIRILISIILELKKL
jgi:hypothetical protein